MRQLRIATELGQMVALAAIVNLCLGLFVGMTPTQAQNRPENRAIKIVAFGDSLTAGYRLAPDQAFPVRLAAKMKAAGHNVTIANAGVSGDTTAGGLARIDWAVPDDTDAVILELGANDALRGLDPAAARKNLEAIISRLKAKGAEVLLAGMRAPANYGQDYVAAFDAIFPELAAKYDLVLYPFFLDGIALDATLNLDDGIHPNARGVDVIVERIMPKVEELIARVKKRHASAATGVQK
jgi:acyl-CoA thioesterase I